jgi:hypothetical protein
MATASLAPDHQGEPLMDASSSLGSLRITGSDLTRRELMEVAAAVTGAALVGGQLMPGFVPQAAAQVVSAAPAPLEVALRVNGSEHRLTVDPRTCSMSCVSTCI